VQAAHQELHHLLELSLSVAEAGDSARPVGLGTFGIDRINLHPRFQELLNRRPLTGFDGQKPASLGSRSVPEGCGQRLGGHWQHITSSASMISQTKSCRIRSESNPQNWRTKGTHFWESQKGQNSKAARALDKILFRIWYLCWNLTKTLLYAPGQLRSRSRPMDAPMRATHEQLKALFKG
jgi:hypothetical protein